MSIFCELDNCYDLLTILNSLALNNLKDEIISMHFLPAGIRLMVENDHLIQAKAYLKESLFTQYQLDNIDSHDIELQLHLPTLIRSLQIFGGTSSSVRIKYNDHDNNNNTVLTLILEHNGAITTCELNTIEANDMLDFNFRDAMIIGRAIVESQFLKDSLNELDLPGVNEISIEMSPNEPYLKLSVYGDSSNASINFPSNQSDLFIEFQAEHHIKGIYDLNVIKPIMKAFAKSERTNIRINEEGMMSMQHIFYASSQSDITSWVEYFLVSKNIDYRWIYG